jgi:C1A family cysteine protease
MSDIDNPEVWTFEPPKKCDQGKVKLFAAEKPYYGPRVNTTLLAMPVKPHVSHAKGLADIQKPIPIEWSWRKLGTNRIEKGGLRDQGKCGGCWAFATASSLGDRYALKYNIQAPYPSSAWLISNAKPAQVPSNLECLTGGNTYLAGKWLEQNLSKLEVCWPYSIIRNRNYVSPEALDQVQHDCCFNCCGDFVKERSSIGFNVVPESTKYIVVVDKSEEGYDVVDVEKTIKAIQREIMVNGPVVSSFNVYDDFTHYWIKEAPLGKIYIRNSDNPNGGHAVVLTGWGQDKKTGVKYWEVRNSWGLTGDGGYCKIAMSTSTPRDKWIQIDIPTKNGNMWIGGVTTFSPGKLKNKKYFKEGMSIDEQKKLKNKGKPQIENRIENISEQDADKTSNVLLYIGIGIAVILFGFLIFKIYKKVKGPSSSFETISMPTEKIKYDKNINNIVLTDDLKNSYLSTSKYLNLSY